MVVVVVVAVNPWFWGEQRQESGLGISSQWQRDPCEAGVEY